MSDPTPVQIVREGARSCVHHWILNDPESGTVSGRCKRCDGERVFSAHVEGLVRLDDDRESQQAARGYAAERVG